MKQKLILELDQKLALKRMSNTAYNLQKQMIKFMDAWDNLEKTDSPIGFMDFQYPFNDKFDNVINDITMWTDDIIEKSKSILENN